MLLIDGARNAKGRASGEGHSGLTSPQGERSNGAGLSLDQIKREKGVWWMPWQQEAMKDVILCDKPRRGENGL